MHKILSTIIISLLFSLPTYSQKPEKLNSGEIFHQIQKLNFLGSVLYIAAHPDDENTRLISYMSNHVKARTAYLSLTRGDGGQNLIGTEIRELLGVIRTQELIEARKIDGGIQYFTRANDFGYSKIPDETLKIWDKEEVLSDMVYVIRKFQPDIIITRFDHRSPGTTHGHHTSSAILTQEAFDIAKDKNQFGDQLTLVKTWEPKRLFFNVSYWFYGGKDKFDQADKSHLINLETGIYYPLLGKSNQEIAALSRSKHQSQGFGATGVRGEDLEYLEFIKGEPFSDKKNLFEGIDTSWKRVKGGENIEKILDQVEKKYDFNNPSASIPELVKAYQLIQKLEDEHWKSVKSQEIKRIIEACAGLYLEAVADQQTATSKTSVIIQIEAINRSNSSVKLKSISIQPVSKSIEINQSLQNNIKETYETYIEIPDHTAYTAPYWLEKEGSVGMYRVDEQENRGKPDILRDFQIKFDLIIEGESFEFYKNIIYKLNDPVKGEVYFPFDITPKVTTSFIDKVKIFNTGIEQNIAVKVTSGTENVKGNLKLDLPKDWIIEQNNLPFELKHKGSSEIIYFKVKSPKTNGEITAKAIVKVDNNFYDQEKTDINYEHISLQQVLKKSEAKYINLNIITKNKTIGYIMGAGDEVPNYLSQLGYEITLLTPSEITSDSLEKYDVIIVGIRAYNVIEPLKFKQEILFDFIKKGKNLIVQYNTTGKLVTDQIAPFSLKISRDRVTEENAEVRFLNPDHPVLNFPNKISSKDFEGWVQEQGLYYPDQWDQSFTPILSANDEGETPKNGALLIAKYGKGYYIYTGLSFFRELPAGVPGAYRLLANMIALGQEK